MVIFSVTVIVLWYYISTLTFKAALRESVARYHLTHNNVNIPKQFGYVRLSQYVACVTSYLCFRHSLFFAFPFTLVITGIVLLPAEVLIERSVNKSFPNANQVILGSIKFASVIDICFAALCGIISGIYGILT